MKYNVKKLIRRYNRFLTEYFGSEYALLDDRHDDIRGNIACIESIQARQPGDTTETWLECEYLKRYLYFKYIENDIDDFKKVK